MLRHILVVAFRTFTRDKRSFLINLIGLSTGLAYVLLIGLWVYDELQVDKFHEKDSQLYQVMQNIHTSGGILTEPDLPAPLVKAMVEEIPEVEAATAINGDFCTPEGIFSFGNNAQPATGLFARDNLFDLFSYKLLKGEPTQVLIAKNSLILSEQLATNLFGSINEAMGKTLDWSYQLDGVAYQEKLQVTGILANLPPNSTEQFDAVVNYDLLVKADYHAGEWDGAYAEIFLLLKPGTDLDNFNKKIADYLSTKRTTKRKKELFARPYSSKYLYGLYEDGVQAGGRITYVNLFSIIALLIMIIACINFMNLSTAQASRKTKEIGIKKAVGAERKSLVFQFLGESVLMATISLLLACIWVTLLIPKFNEITGKSLQLNLDGGFLLAISGIALLTGLIAGSYPAFYLSGFKPIGILKGERSTSFGEQAIRKGLVTFQFSLSVIFIVGVLVIHQQMEYIQTKNLGYSRDNVLCFQIGSDNKNPKVFLSALKNVTGVVSASNLSSSILSGTDYAAGYSWQGEASDKEIIFKASRVGYNVLETLDMELLAGRSFSEELKDDYSKIVLNESALKLMQLEDPIGKRILYGQEERQIIGVVGDFHYGSIHHKVEPLIFRFRDEGKHIMTRIESGTAVNTIKEIENLYKEFHAGHTFEFSFLDQEYQALYQAESKVSVLSTYFSGLAIIISCLGLLGLAIFTTERRSKEIGIRKVLGSSTLEIVRLLSFDFNKMVLAGILIALPISYLVAKNWLNNFAYKIDLHWSFFVAAAGITLVIAWATVGLQTLRAASANPVESLKSE